VSVAAGDGCHVDALVDAQPSQQLALAVNGSSGGSFSTTGSVTWQKADVGTITLTRTGTLSGDPNVKSLELVRQSD
jgi:hypothetical protein